MLCSRMAAAVLTGLTIASVAAPSEARPLLPLHERSTTWTFTAPVTSVIADTHAGSVSVVPGSPTTVTATSRWNLVAPKVTTSLSGGVLTVHATCLSLIGVINSCSVDLSLAVLATASLSTGTAAGHVTVSGLHGPSVRASSNAGGVDLTSIASPIVDASSDAGHVSAVLLAPASSLTLETNAGDVFASVPAGSYDIDATTNAGSVSITGVTDNPSSPFHIDASTSAGDVTIQGH